MALTEPLTEFFTDEWQRFLDGLAGLDPGTGAAVAALKGLPQRLPGEPGAITIPGWDSIIKVGPHTVVPPGSWKEYYKAKKAGRPPDLPPAVLAEINRKLAMAEANRLSNQPPWAKSVGQVMTAIDNVQDFAATLATFGRLLIWAAPKLLARGIPVVGVVVLAADILNMMNFLGMAAMPLYALLCKGPREALTAGIPAALLKNALCKEVWTMAHLNPFSKANRASRRLRSMGRLPGVSNLIELAQVTDNFFGYGLGLGSLYGMLMDGIFANARGPLGSNLNLNWQPFLVSIGGSYVAKAAAMNPADAAIYRQAGQVLAQSTAIAGKQDLIDDETHLLHMAALIPAVGLAHKFFRGGPHQELFDAVAGQPWPAPAYPHPDTAGLLEDDSARAAGIGRWWVEGNPEALGADALVMALGAQVGQAVRDWFLPRRNTRPALLYGACVNTLTENLWYLLSDDPDFVDVELTPDMKLFTGHAVDGRLIAPGTPDANVWRYWSAARQLLEQRGGKLLYPADLERLASATDTTLISLLAPDQAWPAAWRPFFEAPEEFLPFYQNQKPAGSELRS